MTYDTDVDQALRDAGGELTMSASPAQIVRRGTEIRRRRRLVRGLVVASSIVIIGGGASAVTVTTNHPDRGGETSSAVAPGAGVDYERMCRDSARLGGNDSHFVDTPVAQIPLEAPPSKEAVLLVYRSGDAFGWCLLRSGDDGVVMPASTSSDPHFEQKGFVTPENICCDMDQAVAAGLVTDDVVSVQLVIDGTVVDAAVENGVYAAIVPQDSLAGAVVRAYDSAGSMLEERPLPGS